MGKYFIVLFLISGYCSFSQVQLTNSGFENWGTYPSTSIQVPNGKWNVVTSYDIPPVTHYIVTGSRSTDKHSGTYAIELINSTSEGQNSTILEIDNTYADFSGKPYYMEAYYKYTPVGGDQVRAIVELAKYSGTPGIYEVLGSGETLISAAASQYTQLIVPITYNNAITTPDKISVTFKMQNNQTTDGTILLLDDVAFSYTPFTSISGGTSSLDGLVVNSNSISFLDESLVADFELTDLSGKVLLTSSKSKYIDFSALPTGAYLVRLSTPEGRNQVVKVIH